jgi:hypothetical protein
MDEPRIVPLKASIEITTGTLLRAMYPSAGGWHKILIRMIFLIDRISKVKLW